MYVAVKEIWKKLDSRKEISWENAYDLYECKERPKWLHCHGEEMTVSHFKDARQLFSEKAWFRGKIKIRDLYPMTLRIYTPWIQELACSSHLKEKCIYCCDTNPTLEKLIKNIKSNCDSQYYPKIQSIQEQFKEGKLRDIFVILVDDNPPYVYDGNSRLMSIASLPKTEDFRIKCYLGCNKEKSKTD